MKQFRWIRLLLLALLWAGRGDAAPATETLSTLPWDTFSDTWVATDALGRQLPGYAQVGAPRGDRFVGIFYFLWLGQHVSGGPYDVSKILAMQTNNPPWGPYYAPHHWGESIFGYYLTHDPFVLRKHAQMLGDAGVDVVIFDVTNQATYKKNYMALLEVFDDVRKHGGKTPQVAFLCPFWAPSKVVVELWNDLYKPNLYPHLWFRWDGKPLILADPALLADAEKNGQGNQATELTPGTTLGQTFHVTRAFDGVGGCFPTWGATNCGLTLSLFREGPGGERIGTQRLKGIYDNNWAFMRFSNTFPAGTYYLEASEPVGKIGWWGFDKSEAALKSFVDGKPADGARSWCAQVISEERERAREFFTFRKPQPDYFQGPTQPDMWSWLEVYPQHVFCNSKGEKEQMSVGIGQNAVGNRLGSMSEPGAHGRSFHDGKVAQNPSDVLYGYNFAEQFDRALKEDPKFIFITGWNEWIAGRFPEFVGVKGDMFPDEYNQENSRDIEPMKGGHGDNYYYQMVSYIRRYKGVRPPPVASAPKSIHINPDFSQWRDVAPEFRDDIGDIPHRDFPGFNNCARYVNDSGRNDFVALKVARDKKNIYFYARTKDPISPSTDPRWMMLFIDADRDHRTGWEGYDFVVNRLKHDATTGVLERNLGGWNWKEVARVKFHVEGNQIHFAIPRAALGLEKAKGPLRFDFKWADNVPETGNIIDFIENGDVAPNGRFNYRFEETAR